MEVEQDAAAIARAHRAFSRVADVTNIACADPDNLVRHVRLLPGSVALWGEDTGLIGASGMEPRGGARALLAAGIS